MTYGIGIRTASPTRPRPSPFAKISLPTTIYARDARVALKICAPGRRLDTAHCSGIFGAICSSRLASASHSSAMARSAALVRSSIQMASRRQCSALRRSSADFPSMKPRLPAVGVVPRFVAFGGLRAGRRPLWVETVNWPCLDDTPPESKTPAGVFEVTGSLSCRPLPVVDIFRLRRDGSVLPRHHLRWQPFRAPVFPACDSSHADVPRAAYLPPRVVRSWIGGGSRPLAQASTSRSNAIRLRRFLWLKCRSRAVRAGLLRSQPFLVASPRESHERVRPKADHPSDRPQPP